MPRSGLPFPHRSRLSCVAVASMRAPVRLISIETSTCVNGKGWQSGMSRTFSWPLESPRSEPSPERLPWADAFFFSNATVAADISTKASALAIRYGFRLRAHIHHASPAFVVDDGSILRGNTFTPEKENWPSLQRPSFLRAVESKSGRWLGQAQRDPTILSRARFECDMPRRQSGPEPEPAPRAPDRTSRALRAAPRELRGDVSFAFSRMQNQRPNEHVKRHHRRNRISRQSKHKVSNPDGQRPSACPVSSRPCRTALDTEFREYISPQDRTSPSKLRRKPAAISYSSARPILSRRSSRLSCRCPAARLRLRLPQPGRKACSCCCCGSGRAWESARTSTSSSPVATIATRGLFETEHLSFTGAGQQPDIGKLNAIFLPGRTRSPLPRFGCPPQQAFFLRGPISECEPIPAKAVRCVRP